MIRFSPFVKALALLALGLFIISGHAQAATSGGDAPWLPLLSKITDAISGPTAYYLSILAIFSGGATLAFIGHEIGYWSKTVIYLVLVIGLVIFGKGFLMGTTGAGAEVAVIDVAQIILG